MTGSPQVGAGREGLSPAEIYNRAMREWALRCAFDERDVAWINRLYPAPSTTVEAPVDWPADA